MEETHQLSEKVLGIELLVVAVPGYQLATLLAARGCSIIIASRGGVERQLVAALVLVVKAARGCSRAGRQQLWSAESRADWTWH